MILCKKKEKRKKKRPETFDFWGAREEKLWVRSFILQLKIKIKAFILNTGRLNKTSNFDNILIIVVK